MSVTLKEYIEQIILEENLEMDQVLNFLQDGETLSHLNYSDKQEVEDLYNYYQELSEYADILDLIHDNL
jgi:hypothetical protein